MSKFQVGDKVMVDGRELEVVSADDEISKNVWCGLNGKGWVLVPADELKRADPHVPDVDGNPIRVGQLVELVSNDEARGCLGWAVQTFPEDDRTFASVEVDWGPRCDEQDANDLRVVTDLLRPPEPDTRDVTLRVTVTTEPDMPDDLVRDGVESSINSGWPSLRAVTVEVVDEGGHDDG